MAVQYVISLGEMLAIDIPADKLKANCQRQHFSPALIAASKHLTSGINVAGVKH